MSVLRSSVALRGVRPALRPTLIQAARMASSDASSSAADTGSSSKLPMAWTEYFQMRKRRKLWANLTTVPSAAAGFLLGAGYFANSDADPTQMILGMDPMMVYGGVTVASMLGGYLIGPSIGSVLFSVTHPKLARGNPPPLEIMDREFYHRIKAKRADPSRQSVTNPAPDFYGEKIVSIPTYRRWLKDQKAFERKAAHGVLGEEED